MKKKSKRIIIFSILGGLFLLLAIAVILGSKRENIISVQTEEITRRDITQIVTASGRIQPEVEVKISAEVSGEIIDIPLREGKQVKRGDLLVRIRPDTYIAARNRAEAAYLSSQAALRQAEANLEKALADFQRVQELFEKALVSESELIAARTSYSIAKASKESAEYQIIQARASLDQAIEDLAKTTIYSPIGGTVVRLNSAVGERVVGTGLMGGTEIMVIADLIRMEAHVDVDENDVVLVSIGDTARVEVDAYPDRIFTGVVTEIAHAPKVRGVGTQEQVVNFEVKIAIIEKDAPLRPGMSMIADIETARREGVLAVPIQSVTIRLSEQVRRTGSDEAGQTTTRRRRDADRPPEIVFIVENGRVVATPVERGIMGERYVEIIDGLSEGLQVVTGSFRAINRDLEDGALVKVDNESAQPVSRSN